MFVVCPDQIKLFSFPNQTNSLNVANMVIWSILVSPITILYMDENGFIFF